jgi:UDP-N-acetylglucosamine acyltransferase
LKIHPQAIVSPQAELAGDVEVGPFCVIESDVVIGQGCRLEAHVVLKSGTRLGAGNHVWEGSVLGAAPQHVHCPERTGRLEIGSHNTIRENVTMHRALCPSAATRVGDHNYIMVGAHIAHDCVVGSHTILANNVMLGGHVCVADRAYVSGAVAVHQFCRIGAYAMVGGQAHLNRDVPPYVTVDGDSTRIVGLNLVGLRRAGFTTAEIDQLKAAYRLIYRSGLRWPEVLERLTVEFASGPAAQFHPFFTSGKRGFVPDRHGWAPRTIKLAEAVEQEASQARQPLRRLAG